MSAREQCIKLLEAKGYIVIPPGDLPEVKVDEAELMATIDGLDSMAFTGSTLGWRVSLPSTSLIGANHQVIFEYRRAVAHLAMAKWYEQNLEHEDKVCKLRNELLNAEGMEWWTAKPKQLRKYTKQARAILRAGVQS